MKVKVASFPAQNIAYMRRTGPYGYENKLLMGKLKDWIGAKRLWNKDAILYGIGQDNPMETHPESCRYDVCIVVTDDGAMDEHVFFGRLQGGQYLVFTVSHTQESIEWFWNNFAAEVEQQGYSIDSTRPILEKYTLALEQQGLCEFCVPIGFSTGTH